MFEFKLYPSLDFIQEILSHGDEIEILSPQWVREEIASYIILMQRAYKDAIDIVIKKMDEDSLTQ
jgi:predicted DNA-binding transcriptional regulator YafY